MNNKKTIVSSVALLAVLLAAALTAFASGSEPATKASADVGMAEAEKAQAAAEAKLAEAKAARAAAEVKVAAAKSAKAAAELDVAKAIAAKEKVTQNTLYQYSTINALMQGQFEGDKTLREVAEHGDTGLGTFNGVNGELTQINGEFYRFDNEGHFYQVDDKEKTPFVSTVNFQNDKTIKSVRSIISRA